MAADMFIKIIIYTLITAALTGIVGGLLTFLFGLDARKREKKRKEIDDALEAAGEREENIEKSFETFSEKPTKKFDIAEITPERKGELLDYTITDQVKRIDLIQELSREYHVQAISQATAQFWFSLIAASAGFAYILFSTTLVNLEQWATIFNILPGVVIDAVAALFFVQAEKTRQRATELYDRLRTDKNLRISEKILNLIEDKTIRSVAQAQIAIHLAGLEQKEIDVNDIIKKPDADKKS